MKGDTSGKKCILFTSYIYPTLFIYLNCKNNSFYLLICLPNMTTNHLPIYEYLTKKFCLILGSQEENGLVQLNFISNDMAGIDQKLQFSEVKVILKSKTDFEIMSLTLASWDQSVAVHKLIVFTRQQDIRKVEKFFAARNFVLLHQ